MRAAPAYTNQLTACTFAIFSGPSSLSTPSILATPFSATLVANTVAAASLKFTTTCVTTLGGTCALVSSNTPSTGKMDFSADF